MSKSATFPYYVYELVDPRVGVAFYVGKGKGRRAYSHAANARLGNVDNPFKFQRIAAIHRHGLEVEVREDSRHLDEESAFKRERELIAEHGVGKLTNIKPGHMSDRERATAWASALLDRVVPYEQWVAMRRPGPDGKALYWEIVAGLQREAGQSSSAGCHA